MKKIVIIGAGEIGLSIEKILREKEGVEISLWDKLEDKVPNQKPLADTLPLADFVFLCTPSRGVRDVVGIIAPLINKKTIVISLSKGLEGETNKMASDILEELLPDNGIGILGGPMLAEELMKDMGGVGIIGSTSEEVHKQTSKLFLETSLLIKYSSDIRGVAAAGVLKNVYALALGIGDGLGWGGNMKGYLVSRSINEMKDGVIFLGGTAETVFGSAGVGDLIATGFSSYSQNRQAGSELAKTGKCSVESEGFNSLSSVIKLIAAEKSKFPTIEALESICVYNKNSKEIFEQLIRS